MSSRMTCNSCGVDMLPAEATNTPMGNLCEGCYNLFLEFYKGYTKKQTRVSFFIHLIPALLFYAFYFTGNLEDYANDGMSLVILLLILGGAGAYNIVKNGFVEIGDTVRKNYYKATVSSSNEISISDHSYDGYTGAQWIGMAFNVVLFVIGLGMTLVLGPLVFLFRLMKQARAAKKYDRDYNSNLELKKVKVSQDILDSYRGLIAQKALDIDNEYTSIIEGVEMQHLGYLYYQDYLYAAIGTKFENPVFEEDTLYFVRLYPSNNKYDVVPVETELYSNLYENLNSLSE